MYHYLYTWPGGAPLISNPTWTEFVIEIENGTTKLGSNEFLIYIA